MTITAKIIAHSAYDGCPDLITLELKYPRFIHSEFMTHRVFSRNASSSRAIPVKRMIQDVLDDPVMPIEWGSNKPGMQAGEELTGSDLWEAELAWISARDHAVECARQMSAAGAHKQIVNRILEPFQHISVVVTATDWDNFFMLRDHPAAQPEIRELARAMDKAISDSKPSKLQEGDAHLPYGECFVSSAAGCARVSYLNHDGTSRDYEKDNALYEMLRNERHMSPFEHQAIPTPGVRNHNLNGWKSQRAMLEG